jgi:acetyl esterase/lipase
MRGTLLHEFIHILLYWSRVRRVDVSDVGVRKWRFGKHRKQYMLQVEPAEAKRKVAILYYHGGGWRFARPEGFKTVAKILTGAGCEVFLGSHRKLPFFNSRHMREDIQLALQMVRAILDEQGKEDYSIVVGGMSSGGNLSALLAFDPSLRDTSVAGAFFLGAPLDLDQMPYAPPIWQFAGWKGNERYRISNPIEHLNESVTDLPTMIIHGNKDALVRMKNVVSFAERFRQFHPERLQFHIHEGKSHMDIASWSYQDNAVRKQVMAWLDTLA